MAPADVHQLYFHILKKRPPSSKKQTRWPYVYIFFFFFFKLNHFLLVILSPPFSMNSIEKKKTIPFRPPHGIYRTRHFLYYTVWPSLIRPEYLWPSEKEKYEAEYIYRIKHVFPSSRRLFFKENVLNKYTRSSHIYRLVFKKLIRMCVYKKDRY